MTHSPAFLFALGALAPDIRVTDVRPPRPLARLRAAFAAAAARRRARRDYLALLEADDHFFADIGLSRGDVRRAYEEC
jgi:uncharacterized protein YjiS (DUF1127 family)